MSGQVFVNRILNMKKIKLLGLDMDHTLIRYNTQKFESLVYQIVLRKLVEKGYPKSILEFQFDYEKAIRGLVVDSENGNTLKLNRHGAIRTSYHGTQPIGFAEQKKMYRSMYVDLGAPNYMAVDTSFSIAFCVLFAQLIDLKDQNPHELASYAEITRDLSACLDDTHRDGQLKSVVSENLEDYVIKEPEMVKGLLRYKAHGKKIFILTNSEYWYTKALLDFAINPFLDGETWEDLFEYTITFAQKPRFFYDNLKFLKIDAQTGTMTNLDGPIEPGIYQSGSARKFTDDLKINGDEILYIGDHIYGDILRLKKDCNWRTALVVDELGEEVRRYRQAQPTARKIAELMDQKSPLEQRHTELTTLRIDEDSKNYNDEIQKLQDQIATIDEEISQLIQTQQEFFNADWGRVFRTGAEESYFAYQVDRFACIYMEKLADLLAYSPRTYFRAARRPLAHELGLE